MCMISNTHTININLTQNPTQKMNSVLVNSCLDVMYFFLLSWILLSSECDLCVPLCVSQGCGGVSASVALQWTIARCCWRRRLECCMLEPEGLFMPCRPIISPTLATLWVQPKWPCFSFLHKPLYCSNLYDSQTTVCRNRWNFWCQNKKMKFTNLIYKGRGEGLFRKCLHDI